MILEVKKRNNQYVLNNFPVEKEQYYITVNVENISSVRSVACLNKNKHSINEKAYEYAIASLNLILQAQPDNNFVKRKIDALSNPIFLEEEITDKEALYLALSEKYGL